MRFNPFEGLKKAVDLKNESETVKKIKADMISASKNKDKKAIYKYFNGEAIIDSLSMTTDTAKKAKELSQPMNWQMYLPVNRKSPPLKR